MIAEVISKSLFKSFPHSFSSLLDSPQHQKQAIVTALLNESLKQQASDINIETTSDNFCEIFFRIHGTLHKVLTISGPRAIALREAVQNGTQNLHAGNYGVIEGTLSILQQQGESFSFQVYNIPQSPANSLLIRNMTDKNTAMGKAEPPAKKSNNNINKKIFIWQMGKVGSSTIYRSLHPYSKQSTWQIPSIKDNIHWPIHNNIIQTHSIKLLYDFLHYSEEEFIIISLVRDLLARNISSIFQSMNYEEEGHNDYFIANIDEFKKMPYALQEQKITQHLRNLNTGTAVTSWYDNILKSHFYYPEIDKYFIDIYSKPFDQEKGYQLYESKNSRIKMIILRLEDLNEQKKTLEDFLGIDNFHLKHENVAKNKWYHHIYMKFKERYQPTKDELESIYNSRFMRYFYAPEQIKLMVQKWDKTR